jgi:hypothetical protein
MSTKQLSVTESQKILGVAGTSTRNGTLKAKALRSMDPIPENFTAEEYCTCAASLKYRQVAYLSSPP